MLEESESWEGKEKWVCMIWSAATRSFVGSGKWEEKNVLKKEKKVKGQMNERSDDMIISSGCAEIYTNCVGHVASTRLLRRSTQLVGCSTKVRSFGTISKFVFKGACGLCKQLD
ncbi:hypothetical protein FCV25MIE_18437 [Fagus crenata]